MSAEQLDRIEEIESAQGIRLHSGGRNLARISGDHEELIARYTGRLKQNPGDTEAMGGLGMLYLDQAREVEDAACYSRAESLFQTALEVEARDFTALVGMGSLCLSRHQFRLAEDWSRRGLEWYPESAPLLAILVDAQVELGEYPQAVETLDQMLSVRPDLTSYSRASYLRELHGDMEGAIEVMEMAADAGPAGSEEASWCRVHLGDLHFKMGRLDEAERAYRQADAARPGYPRALAGLARVAAARGEIESAEILYRAVIEEYPLAQYYVELGDLYAARGRVMEAEGQYALVREAAGLARAHGMNVDLEMALFEADHGAAGVDLVVAAREAYADRPSVTAAHVLAWTLYRAGRYAEAKDAIREALRLGTKDPELYFHSGMIHRRAGDQGVARRHLQAALEMNPAFSVVDAELARSTLAELR